MCPWSAESGEDHRCRLLRHQPAKAVVLDSLLEATMTWAHAVYLICTGMATGSLARRRGRSFYAWFVFGAAAWFVAIPWLLLTKSRLYEGAQPIGKLWMWLLPASCALGISVANYAFAPAKLPNCDYYTNIAALNETLSRDDRAGAPQIVTVDNIKEISRSKDGLRCSARVHLDQGSEVQMEYRFFIEEGKLRNEAHW
jgi:hypothetical protein